MSDPNLLLRIEECADEIDHYGAHAEAVVVRKAIAEIASLRAQLDAAKCKIEELGTHCALHESLAHGYTDEIAELQCRVDEARRKAIEECAAIAEQDRDFCDYDTASEIAKSIRALLSESKT